MVGYDQTIKVKAAYYKEAKDFFAFLQAVGRKYARPTRINYRYLKRGRFYVIVDGSPGGIDALFQELILNRGLYYYICSLRGKNKRAVIKHVVIPIFQDFLEYRFENPYSKFVRRHLTGRAFEEKYVPGDLSDHFSHQYEVLFRKWDIGSVDDWHFIKDLDALITQFMLTQLGHSAGARSPRFYILVDRAYRHGVGMDPEIQKLFNKIHEARTDGLHKLKIQFSHKEITELAFQAFNYFQYFDEFKEAQGHKTEKLHGKRYRRIKYGDEKWIDEKGEPYKDEIGKPIDCNKITQQPCHDCLAIKGQYHCFGCDVERCPRCKLQRLSCGCKLQKDYK